MILTIDEKLKPVELLGKYMVEEWTPNNVTVRIDGKEVPKKFAEIILTGLAVMSNTYGKSMKQLIKENT